MAFLPVFAQDVTCTLPQVCSPLPSIALLFSNPPKQNGLGRRRRHIISQRCAAAAVEKEVAVAVPTFLP